MTNNDYLRQRLELRAGLAKFPEDTTLASLRKTQWCRDFVKYCRNRMIMGGMRYGPFRHPDKPTYDNIDSIIKRAEEYKRTGNDELLCDISNLALCEFVEGIHPKKNFTAEDDGQHVEQK